MDPDDLEALVMIFWYQQVQVRDRTFAVDAAVRPEIHEDHILADKACDGDIVNVHKP